jgi:Domain of unknown function (DUF4384)
MRLARSLLFLLGALAAAGGAEAQETMGPDGGAARGVRVDAWPSPSRSADVPMARGTGGAALPVSPPLKNNVGLAFQFAPSAQLSLGSKMSLRIRSAKAGYIVVVDVDAKGRTTQIYPNARSAGALSDKDDQSNRIAAGASIAIPPSDSKSYEFVASPPTGIGMTMAIYSPTPLQVIDLPDVPADLLGRPDEAKFLSAAAQDLRFVPTGGGDDFKAPDLSFAAQFYMIH